MHNDGKGAANNAKIEDVFPDVLIKISMRFDAVQAACQEPSMVVRKRFDGLVFNIKPNILKIHPAKIGEIVDEG